MAVTGDLIALVASLPSDGRRVRTLLVLRPEEDGSHDVIDLAWAGLGGGGLVLRLARADLVPAVGHAAGGMALYCLKAADARLVSLPVIDYGQKKLEFKSATHAENARPYAVSVIESVSGKTFDASAPHPESDLCGENFVSQWKRTGGLTWFEVRGGGAGDRHFYASAEPLAVLAISYSEDNGSRESAFTLVSETEDLSARFSEIEGALRKTPLLRR